MDTYTIPVFVIGLILLGHWAGDFFFQSHWMAVNKSKSNRALSAHVVVYTICLGIVCLGIFKNPADLYLWMLINMCLHFVTDYFTSRVTSKLFAKNDWHNFFVVVGVDQLIHYFTLISTYLIILEL